MIAMKITYNQEEITEMKRNKMKEILFRERILFMNLLKFEIESLKKEGLDLGYNKLLEELVDCENSI